MAGEMLYLTGRRAEMRADPRSLLASARSIVCVGKLYDGSEFERGGISRYALGHDYHQIVRDGLKKLVERLKQSGAGPFYWKICVDTAPLSSAPARAGPAWGGSVRTPASFTRGWGPFSFWECCWFHSNWSPMGRRRSAAEPARAVSMPAPPAPSSPLEEQKARPGLWMRVAAFLTSPSSCGARCRRAYGTGSDRMSSAATSASRCVPGTARRRRRASRALRPGARRCRWNNWSL